MKLKATLEEIQRRFDSLGESIDERLQSNEYLGLVRKAFRAWDEADTEEKRHYTANLIVTAARTIRRAIRLILISRFLERIGDHATNIAEMVVYMVEGKMIRDTRA